MRPRMAAAARRASTRASALAVTLLVAAGFLAGCRTTGLVFGSSELRVTSPSSAATVTLPMTVTWTAGGLYQPGDSYAVFLDQQPVGPGRSVLDVIPDACKAIPTCPRADYLRQANVWLATRPSLVLATLPETGQRAGREYHTITIVLLNSGQVRTSEEFASVDFVYLRQTG